MGILSRLREAYPGRSIGLHNRTTRHGTLREYKVDGNVVLRHVDGFDYQVTPAGRALALSPARALGFTGEAAGAKPTDAQRRALVAKLRKLTEDLGG